jgi:outer membrane protein TolC
MRRLLFLGTLALCMGLKAADAQSGLSLEQAQVEAAQNSPDLLRLKAANDVSAWKKLEMSSGYLPHLSMQASQVLDEKYLYLGVKFGGEAINFPEAFPSSTIGLNLTETIFDGLGTWHAAKAASLEHDASELELEDASFRLSAQVRLRYFQALAAAQLANVANQNILTLQEHLDNVQTSENSGSATQFEVLRVQSKLEEAKAEKVLEDDNVVLAKAALFQAMGKSQPDARELEGDLPVPVAALVTGADLERRSRADLAALALRAKAAREKDSASDAFWFPSVSAFGGDEYYKYDSYDPAIIPSDGYQQNYTVGLNLSWNLFDGGFSVARQKEAEKMAVEAEQALKAQELKTPLELEQWRRRYLYNVMLYQARLRSQEESEESVRLAQLGLKAGTLTHTESLDAETDLFRARAGVVRAQMDAIEAMINLELALGRSL